MVSKVYAEYHDDDDDLVCALLVDPDTFAIQGFWSPAIATMRKPQALSPRVEVFYNWLGKRIFLPYPTTTWPHALGEFVTIRGDPTYVKVATISEFNQGEAGG